MAVQQGNFRQGAVQSTPIAVFALAGLAVVAIWTGVVVASMFAPDMITGSEHDHLPIVGWTYWIWGLVSSGSVLLAAQRGIRARVTALAPWLMFACAVAVVWIAVMFAAIFAPVFVTGTDPTELPLAALAAPIVGTVLTGGIGRFFETAIQPDKT